MLFIQNLNGTGDELIFHDQCRREIVDGCDRDRPVVILFVIGLYIFCLLSVIVVVGSLRCGSVVDSMGNIMQGNATNVMKISDEDTDRATQRLLLDSINY